MIVIIQHQLIFNKQVRMLIAKTHHPVNWLVSAVIGIVWSDSEGNGRPSLTGRNFKTNLCE